MVKLQFEFSQSTNMPQAKLKWLLMKKARRNRKEYDEGPQLVFISQVLLHVLTIFKRNIIREG
uniref:Uncharacterized protein n=1 Tax=Octopus bimaculoides TaxID=37653 RepID=A0A0L8II18_OCTBM